MLTRSRDPVPSSQPNTTRWASTAITAVACGIAWTAAAAGESGSYSLWFAVVGAIALVWLFNKPLLALAAVVVLSATIFVPEIKVIQVGPVRSDPPMVLAYLSIVWWGFSRRTRQPSNGPAIGLALIVGSTLIGAVHGVAAGSPTNLVIADVKTYMFYLLALPLSAALSTSGRRAQAETFVVRLCTATAAYVLAYVLSGGRLPFVAPDQEVETLSQVMTAQRIRPAVLSLLFLATLLLIARAATGGWNWPRTAQLGLFTFLWIVSFNRSSWLPLAAMAIVLLALRRGHRVPLRGLRLAVIIAGVASVTGLAAASGAFGPTGKAAVTRAFSIFEATNSSDPSYKDRATETQDAINALEAHPVLGVGVAHSYGYVQVFYDSERRQLHYGDRVYLHNGLLLLYLHAGLLGLAALGYFLWRLYEGARASLRRLAVEDANRALAGALSAVGLGLAGLAQTDLLDRPYIIAMAVSVSFIPSATQLARAADASDVAASEQRPA